MRKRVHFRKHKSSKLSRLRSNALYKQYLKDRGILKCAVCEWFDPLTQPFFLIEIHHCIQVCNGGTHETSNLLPLCPSHHNVADRISMKHKGVDLNKEAMISLIRQHDRNRVSAIERMR
jgi:hypothetical protein